LLELGAAPAAEANMPSDEHAARSSRARCALLRAEDDFEIFIVIDPFVDYQLTT
jgi:hypothetical protein